MLESFILAYNEKEHFLHTKWDLCFQRHGLACCLVPKQNTISSTFNNSRCFITTSWFEIWERANKTTRSLKKRRRFRKDIFSNKNPQDRKTENAYILDSEFRFCLFFFPGGNSSFKSRLPLARGYTCTVHSFSSCPKHTESHCFRMVSRGWGKMLLVV